jgi:hypothetical protein
MALSPEQISEINKRNAARSTGPKSDFGKSHSSMNACTHGLRAETLTLPGERRDWVRELTAEWDDHYQARSPGRRALVDRAVLATVHHKRSRAYLTGTLDEQVRSATLNFNVQQEDVVRHYMELLKAEPGAAVRGLNRSAGGCRQLINEWVALDSELESYSCWVTARREHATRLLGRCPEDPNDETAFWIRYYNIAAQEPRTDATQAELACPKSWPNTVRWNHGGVPPTPQQSQEWLRKTVATELATLRALEERLRTEFEQPARAAAVEKAMLLKPADMALWLRYERMHDAMFHRAYNALERREAPRPEVEPIPEMEPQREDKAVSSPASQSEIEAAAAASKASVPASAGPVGAAEADAERQTKRVATDAPVAPAVSAEPVGMATPPVARPQEGTDLLQAGEVEKPAPAASLEPCDPGEEATRARASLVQSLLGEDVTGPLPEEAEENLSRASPWPAAGVAWARTEAEGKPGRVALVG